MMKASNRLSWIIVLIGIWELISPFILSFTAARTAFWNNIIFGIVLIILGAWSAVTSSAMTMRTLDWINVLVGIWLIISPFVLGFANTTALWNNVIVGIVVAVLEAWAALSVVTRPAERYDENM